METRMMHCNFNKMVDCSEAEKKCGKCGWNPKVAEKRVQEFLKSGCKVKKDAYN